MGWREAVVALLVLAAACGGEETAPRGPRPADHVASNAGAVVRVASLDRLQRDLGWIYRLVTDEDVASSLLEWRGLDRRQVDAGRPFLIVARPADWYAVMPRTDGTFQSPVPAAAAPPPLARDLPEALVSGRFDPERLGWPALGVEHVEFRADRDGPCVGVELDLRTGSRLETTPVAGILGRLPRDFPVVLAFGFRPRDVAAAVRTLVDQLGVPTMQLEAVEGLQAHFGGGVVTALEFEDDGITLVQVAELAVDDPGIVDRYAAFLKSALASLPALRIEGPLTYEMAGAQVRELRATLEIEKLIDQPRSAFVFEAPDADAAAEAAAVLGARLDALGEYPRVSAFGKEVVVDRIEGRLLSSDSIRELIVTPGGGLALGTIEPPGSATFERLWRTRPATEKPWRWIRVADDARLRVAASRHRKGWMLCRMLPLTRRDIARVEGHPAPWNSPMFSRPASIVVVPRDDARSELAGAVGEYVALVVGEEVCHETRVQAPEALTFKGGLTDEASLRLRALAAAPPLDAPVQYRGLGPGSIERTVTSTVRGRMRQILGADGLHVRLAVRGRRFAVVFGGAPRLLPEVLATMDGGLPVPPALARSLAVCGGNPDLLLHVDLEATARQLHRLAGGQTTSLVPPFHRAHAAEPARLWTEAREDGIRIGCSLDLDFLREAVDQVQRQSTLETCRYRFSDVANEVRNAGEVPASFAKIYETGDRINPHPFAKDAWGHDLWIEDLGGGRFRVGSSGPDGERGTADDLGEPYLDPPLGDVAPDAGRRWLARRAEALRAGDVDAYVELLTWAAYRRRLFELEMLIERVDREPEIHKRLREIAGDGFRDIRELWRATLAREDTGLRFAGQSVEGNRLVVTCADGTKFELVRDGNALRLAPDRD
jgi:hypothetical protein